MTKIIIAISGKRKSGKDYCSNKIKEAFETKDIPVSTSGISHKLKEEYAKTHGLDFEELLTDGPYKERFRKDMIQWGEEARSRDPGIFCSAAIDSVSRSGVVIISDCRRASDYAFFKLNYKTLTIRVETSEENRKQRGFQFVEGIDDAESECGLDEYHHDFVLKNLTGENISPQIEQIVEMTLNLMNKS